MSSFKFTYDNLRRQYEAVLEHGYTIMTCEQYCRSKSNLPGQKTLVNRVDVDLSCKKVLRLIELFADLDIKATFFVRLHAPEYNPFSFENYRIIKSAILAGHEVGYHSEVVDQAAVWDEDPKVCLMRDLKTMSQMFETEIKGVASHGGMTGLNNLDFWKDKKPRDFGLMYEAYDHEPEFNLFQESLYVSDSEWTRWKCYNEGEAVEGPDLRKSLAEHVIDKRHELIYLLIHSDTYFDRHIYEDER